MTNDLEKSIQKILNLNADRSKWNEISLTYIMDIHKFHLVVFVGEKLM